MSTFWSSFRVSPTLTGLIKVQIVRQVLKIVGMKLPLPFPLLNFRSIKIQLCISFWQKWDADVPLIFRAGTSSFSSVAILERHFLKKEIKRKEIRATYHCQENILASTDCSVCERCPTCIPCTLDNSFEYFLAHRPPQCHHYQTNFVAV